MRVEEAREVIYMKILEEKKQIYLVTLEIIKKGSNNVFC